MNEERARIKAAKKLVEAHMRDLIKKGFPNIDVKKIKFGWKPHEGKNDDI